MELTKDNLAKCFSWYKFDSFGSCCGPLNGFWYSVLNTGVMILQSEDFANDVYMTILL